MSSLANVQHRMALSNTIQDVTFDTIFIQGFVKLALNLLHCVWDGASLLFFFDFDKAS